MSKALDVMFGKRGVKTKFPLAPIFIILCILTRFTYWLIFDFLPLFFTYSSGDGYFWVWKFHGFKLFIDAFTNGQLDLIFSIILGVVLPIFIMLVEVVICVLLFTRVRGVALIVAESAMVLHGIASVVSTVYSRIQLLQYDLEAVSIFFPILTSSIISFVLPLITVIGISVLIILDMPKKRPPEVAFKVIGILTAVSAVLPALAQLILSITNITTYIQFLSSYDSVKTFLISLVLMQVISFIIQIFISTYQIFTAIWLINPYKKEAALPEVAESATNNEPVEASKAEDGGEASKPTYTKEYIKAQLAAMGAPRRGVTLVHTALSLVGEVEGRGEGLLDALIEYFTEDGGILAVPTHTWDNLGTDRITLDLTLSESNLGKFTEIAARDGRGVRSENPTHSVVLFGDRERALKLIGGDKTVSTPTSPDSFYGKLYECGGKVLLIGVSHNRNTYLHTVDEMLGIKNRMSDKYETVTVKYKDGTVKSRPLALFDTDYTEDISLRFHKFETAFRYHGAIKDGFVGDAPAQLADARIMKDTVELIYRRAGEIDPLATEEPIPPSFYVKK